LSRYGGVLGCALTLALAACGGSPPEASRSGWPEAGGGAHGDDAGGTIDGSPVDAGAPTGDAAGSPPSAEAGPPVVVDGGPVAAGASRGTIDFHLLLGVAGSKPGDSLTLDGDGYTDLIASNFVAGVMLGHLVRKRAPGIQFDEDYLYGSIFAQLLQENLATELYSASSPLIDSSPLQQAVMGAGQGGPYQINEYAADMVHGSYAPQGGALINYVALQKNIGYALADAAQQYTKPTPPSFDDKLYGPMLTAYFHYNDFVALQAIGPAGGYTPPWEPAYDQAIANFGKLPDAFLDVLLNVAYNQGYYGPLMTQYSQLGSKATPATVASLATYDAAWGVSDTYQQYPFQVRYYLDQLYDNPAPKTGVVPDNHVVFRVAGLGDVFSGVMQTLAHVDASSKYVFITQAEAGAAFQAALAKSGATAVTLDLSAPADRARIFTLLEDAIAGLEASLGADFTATTLVGL
jgi:hypothetical protein